jgi:hypothetical protein
MSNLSRFSEMSAGEKLVLLDDTTAFRTLEALQKAFHVLHVVSPRLVIVQADDDASDGDVRSFSGVLDVVTPEQVGRITEAHELSPSEQLLVDGWLRRMAEQGRKQRPGEGLTWDAEGFSPPDPPPDTR